MPILNTLLGIVIVVRPVQPAKAFSSMVVTLLGIVIDVNPVQFLKALFAIQVTPFGIVEFWHPVISLLDAVSIIALQFSRES